MEELDLRLHGISIYEKKIKERKGGKGGKYWEKENIFFGGEEKGGKYFVKENIFFAQENEKKEDENIFFSEGEEKR